MSRILLAVPSLSAWKGVEHVAVALANRGHAVRVATETQHPDVSHAARAAHSGIGATSCPGRRADDWRDSILGLRGFRDYLRYLDARFDRAAKLRKRALLRLIKGASKGAMTQIMAVCGACEAELRNDSLGHMLQGVGPDGLKAIDEVFRLAEEDLSSDAAYDRFLSDEKPDVVLVTPLVSFGSGQPDIVKSARSLGIPVAALVGSWDSLSTKGLMHVVPDRVFVWNDVQRAEAVELHHVAADRVAVTGAPRFDAFFQLRASTSREDFCRAHGLDPAKPIITYLCSSDFVAKDESAFISRWIEEVRQNVGLKECGIVIRPHPKARRTWKGYQRQAGVAFVPSAGADAEQTLYDVLAHADAVVALNTSAVLEAAILRKPVLTILVPEYIGGQQDTLHFHYFLKEQGGFVQPASEFDAHRQQLAETVAETHHAHEVGDPVERLIRPGGLGHPAATLVADGMESLAG